MKNENEKLETELGLWFALSFLAVTCGQVLLIMTRLFELEFDSLSLFRDLSFVSLVLSGIIIIIGLSRENV